MKLSPLDRSTPAATPNTRWWPGRPLTEAKHAHKTNTREQFNQALKGGFNSFEGDVRVEINPPHHLEMRHDLGQEPGDNLTLKQWLAAGKKAGVLLKLDIKETTQMPELIAEVKAANLPPGMVMFNLGAAGMEQWGPTLRKEFPQSIMALNPAGPLTPANVNAMLAQAKKVGQPLTFVLNFSAVTDPVIRQLEAVGPVSIWNDPSSPGVTNPTAQAADLKRRGVTGVVDLRTAAPAQHHSPLDVFLGPLRRLF